VPLSKEVISELPPGTIWYQRAGGGGGYGDPFRRPAEKVLKDVKNGVLSAAAAREDYGVVIDPETLEVDQEATRLLRNELSG